MSEDTDKIPPESDQREYKQSWDKECFKTLCAFANTKGGSLYVGVINNSVLGCVMVVGVPDTDNLSKQIENDIKKSLSIAPVINTQKNNVVQIEVNPSYNPIKYNNSCYIRENNINRKLKEDDHTEFKEFWRKDGDYFKALCAFCNTEGGVLYFGINDHGEAVGVRKRNNGNVIEFGNTEKLLESLLETLPQEIHQKLKIIPDKVSHIEINEKDIIRVEVKSGDVPVSYKGNFYKRIGNINQPLQGSDLVNLLREKTSHVLDSLPKRENNPSLTEIKSNQKQLRLLICPSGRAPHSHDEILNFKEKPKKIQTLDKVKHIGTTLKQPIISTAISIAMVFSFGAFTWFHSKNIDDSIKELNESIYSLKKEVLKNAENLPRLNDTAQGNSNDVNSASSKLEARDIHEKYGKFLKEKEEKIK